MSSGAMSLAFFCPDQLAEGADALGQRGAQPGFVGAAIGGGDGVAVIGIGPVRPQRPGHRPFGPALFGAGEVLRSGEELGGDAFARADLFLEVIREPAGELEHRLGGNLLAGEAGGAFPTDLDPGEEVGLGAGELEQPRRLEPGIVAEDFAVRDEGDAGAAAVGGGAERLELAGGQPA